jgi:hypothetical protein
VSPPAPRRLLPSKRAPRRIVDRSKRASAQIASMKRGKRELGATKVAADEGHAAEHRMGEVGAAEVHVIEDGMRQHQPLERSLLIEREEALWREAASNSIRIPMDGSGQCGHGDGTSLPETCPPWRRRAKPKYRWTDDAPVSLTEGPPSVRTFGWRGSCLAADASSMRRERLSEKLDG